MAPDARKTARPQSPALKRTSTMTTASSTATSSLKGSQYWDNLMCLFLGLSPNQPSGTSVNNRDFFPPDGQAPAKPASTSPPTSSRPSSISVKQTSLIGRSLSQRRSRSQGSFTRKFRRDATVADSVASFDSNKLDAVPESECLHSPTASCRGRSASSLVPVQKDGQTFWIPEAILSQFVPDIPSSRPTDLVTSNASRKQGQRKPNMKIAIPSAQVSGPLRSRSSTAEPGSPSVNLSSPSSSTPASATWSSCQSQGTSRTSTDVTTPSEPNLKSNLLSPDCWSIADPAADGVFEQDAKDASHNYQSNPHGHSQSVIESSSVERMTSAPDMPTRPKRRSKARDWARSLSRRGRPKRKLSKNQSWPRVPSESIPPMPASTASGKAATPANDKAHVIRSRKSLQFDGNQVSSDAAEAVILAILQQVTGLADLSRVARINKGFYSVYRRNQLMIANRALWNASPAAWELRETSPKVITSLAKDSGSGNSAKTLIQLMARDSHVLKSLKAEIVKRCEFMLRPETVEGLRSEVTSHAGRVDDALWRIWTFCTLFGPDTSFESDTEGQLDWLRGGLVANRESPSTGDADSAESILKTSPVSFGLGNSGGLSAEELLSMMEMWNCIRALLSIVSGPAMVAEARRYGVFDNQGVRSNDRLHEEFVFKEWINHLMLRGLSTALDVAQAAEAGPSTVFLVASSMGWTSWQRPSNEASRANFLSNVLLEACEEIAATGPSVPAVDTMPKYAEATLCKAPAKHSKHTKHSHDMTNIFYDQERPVNTCIDWIKGLDTADKPHLSSLVTVEEECSESLEYPPNGAESTAQPALSRFSCSDAHDTASSTYTSAATSAHNSRPSSPAPPREPRVPAKSADRTAMIRLVSQGWKAEEAKDALRATAAGPGSRDITINSLDASIERAITWMKERQAVAA